VFAALLLFSPTAAQTEVRVLVSDSATADAIEGALVEVTRADGTLVWRGLSGGDGHATTRLTPGEFVVTSSMLGRPGSLGLRMAAHPPARRLFMEAGERDLPAVTSMSTLLRRYTGSQ
jgi:hypothetical protein